MGWINVRPATDEDKARLHATAKRFAERHDFYCARFPETVCPAEVAMECDDPNTEYRFGKPCSYYRNLWRKAARRALRETTAYGIAFNCVGYHSK